MYGLIPATLTALFLITALLLLERLPVSLTTGTKNDFIVQTVVVIDLEGVSKWQKATGKSTNEELEAEVNSFMVGVNDAYKSLSKRGNDLKIQFEKPKITILNRNILYSPYGTVNAETSKRYFQSWLQRNSKSYDIAILMTGYDLESRGDTGTAGHANMGTVCEASAVVVAEISGRYIDPLIMAHEMGHVMNVDHDGFISSASCSYRDYYVMTPGLNIISPNKYFFSQCSYDSLYKMLVTNKRGERCLMDGDKDNLATGPRLGTMVTPDSMCQRLYGAESMVDRTWYKNENNYKTDVCNKLRCVTRRVDPYDLSLPWAATDQGASCAKNSRCVQGVCQESQDGDPKVLNTCPFGDQTTNLFSKRDCASLKEDECYYWQAECCDKCNQFQDSVADKLCRQLEGSKSSLARGKYSEWGDEVCENLYCTVKFDYTWRANRHDTPEGMGCGKNKQCKNKKCVPVSTGGDPSMPDQCPFGDQPWFAGAYQRNCKAIIDYYGCDSRWGPMCCRMCAGKIH